MLRAIFLKLFHRPAVRMGRVDNRRIRTSAVRNAQFISFITASGCLPPRRLAPHDAGLRRRRWLRRAAFAGLTLLGATAGAIRVARRTASPIAA